jgi:hypothetical protein
MADENVDALRAQNATLRIQCHSNESEILRLKHALDLAMTKAGSWGGMKQRVTVNKPVLPAKDWLHAESSEQVAGAGGSSAIVPFAASTVAASLEHQVREKAEELRLAQEHNAATEKALQDACRARDDLIAELETFKSSHARTRSDSAATSHLMAQLQFLHGELERLESEVASVRADSAEQLRAANIEHATALAEYEAKLKAAADEKHRLLGRLGPAARQLSRMENGEDFLARCRILEGQLAAALAEKNAFSIEKHELMTKLRKMEAVAKEKKLSLAEVQKQAFEESASNEETGRTLRSIVDSLSAERSSLQEQLQVLRARLAAPRVESGVQSEAPIRLSGAAQCDPPPAQTDGWCQVDSIRHFADPQSASMHSVAHLLETKCAEVESLTQQLDELARAHRDTLTLLEQTRKRLQDEATRRQQSSDDCERLGLQVRSLQQRTSQQSAAEREKDVRLRESEDKMQEAVSSRLRIEAELQEAKELIAMHHTDMQNVVQSQNFANHQINSLASENDALRGEIQKLLHREAQCNFSIRAKEVELGEILAAYQQCVRESEQHIQARGILEREVDNARAAASAKEERIINLQEQIGHLHAREQQLALDLQSFDYEGGQLQRKLVQSESTVAHLEGQVHDLVQSLHASERVTEELERNLSELSKQIVLKDNECMLLRQRSDNAEREWATMNISRQTELHRLRELEDANARLVVRGILTSQQQQAAASPAPSTTDFQLRDEQQKKALAETTAALADANAALQNQEKQCSMHIDRARALELALREEQLAKERLQRVVLDQAAILSQLSK